MLSYEELLEKAYKEMPEEREELSRAEIPKATGRLIGNTTIINNFFQIAKFFHRDPQHFMKFLLKELATPGKIEGDRLVLGRRLNPKFINEKIVEYAERYVICPDCKKLDTQLITENGVLYIKCMACGAKHVVKEK